MPDETPIECVRRNARSLQTLINTHTTVTGDVKLREEDLTPLLIRTLGLAQALTNAVRVPKERE